LGQLRIRGDKSTYPLAQLSGGEKLKVALLGLSHAQPMPELLLLDEPENHLDIESRELFANAISSYEGSVLL
ncbi:AAA family ATPase, partial [Acinetobacter pittii]|nr:ABC transporter ATP-binding protein [Acinetobacter pittii]